MTGSGPAGEVTYADIKARLDAIAGHLALTADRHRMMIDERSVQPAIIERGLVESPNGHNG